MMKSNVAALGQGPSRGLRSSKPMTGRTVVVWLCVVFVIMFGANVALIYTALSTLHGEELENPYDASQAYNQRIAEARAQEQLGWVVNVTARPESGGVHVFAEFRDRDGALIPGLEVRARFMHPFDRDADRETLLVCDGGSYEGLRRDLAPRPMDVGRSRPSRTARASSSATTRSFCRKHRTRAKSVST